MDRGRDADTVAVGEIVDPSRPAVRVAVAERHLLQLERPAVQPAAQVARIDQRELDPLLGRGVDERLAELVALSVQVVELADRGDPGLEHLPKHQPAVLEIVGGVPLGVAVHALAPLPEIAPAGLHLPAEKPLERVAVDVGEAGHRPAFEHRCVVGGERVLFDRLDATALDLDEHVLGAAADPRLLGVPPPGSVQRQKLPLPIGERAGEQSDGEASLRAVLIALARRGLSLMTPRK